ncbi:hypothetical protein C8034_v006535 [Colletotrichum sidae]|uniref:Uncharacterized protein n=1 Tax=Colletotrichum sidae TaxID=1347389 RepID=A0A4R8T4L9_9PEZI|nr:hypothetical protein C8034_v006535 [Colletotrichum sidae]
MAFTSQYHMPGAYFDTQPGGVHPGVFRPPSSPSTGSSLYLAKSTGTYQTEPTTPLTQSRRRRQTDISREATPLNEWCDGNMSLDGSGQLPHRQETPRCDREARYTLAGQLETPGVAVNPPFENGTLDESMYSDADYRRKLGSKRPHEEVDSPVSGQPTVLVQPTQPVGAGWSRFALSTLGGVVGKVWEFCTAGAFKGFSAGGGKAYTIDGQSLPDPIPELTPRAETGPQHEPKPRLRPNPEPELSEKVDLFPIPTPEPALPLESPLPFIFGQPSLLPEVSHEDQVPETTPLRPAVKRRQTSATGHDELRNWVVVDDRQSTSSRRSLPRATTSMRPLSRNTRPSVVTGRRISIPRPRLDSTPVSQRRPSTSHSTLSHAGTVSLSPREPASFAGFRSPETPNHFTGPSPSRIPLPVQSGGMSPNPFAKPSNPSLRQSAIPSPVQPITVSPKAHRRSHSNASAASSRPKTVEYGVGSIGASPRLDAEARRLATRRVRNEQDSDARIDDFNQRLKEMIRQGREALGTKFEIDDEGGWMDDGDS